VLNVELMPWQIVALNGQLEHDEAGALFHRQSLVSVARQNGKTVALKSLLGFWLTEMAAMRGEKQTVISTAHELSLASALFQELAPILETHYGAKAKWSFGRNELTMPDGSMWLVRAATPSAGHGRSPDLILADEIWDISADVIDQGLMPSQRARKSPLLSMWSTAGTEASDAMTRWRNAGIRIIDTGADSRLFFAEWSPPPGVELMSKEGRRYWGWANPALGHTLDLDTLEAEAEAPNRAAFLRGSLNLWVATDQGWLKPGVWEGAATDSIPETGGVLSVETSMDESRYVGVRSVSVEDNVVTTVAFTCDTLAGFLDHLTEAMQDTKLQLTATPSLSEHVPLELRRRMTVVGYSELLRFTSLVRSLITEGRLRHTGEIELAEHMNRSVAVKTTAGLALSSQRSPGPIELARCLVWSAAMASKPTSKAQPAIIVGKRRH
jgi:phage terminase large subunit-like protein